MTDSQFYRNQYESDRYGRIIEPGKFEGEQAYVPYFWDCALNGFADDDDGTVYTFNVSDADRKQWPELGERKTVRLYQREDGFVCEL